MKYKVTEHQAMVLLSAFACRKKKDEARLTSDVLKPDSNTQTVIKAKAKTLILMEHRKKCAEFRGKPLSQISC